MKKFLSLVLLSLTLSSVVAVAEKTDLVNVKIRVLLVKANEGDGFGSDNEWYVKTRLHRDRDNFLIESSDRSTQMNEQHVELLDSASVAMSFNDLQHMSVELGVEEVDPEINAPGPLYFRIPIFNDPVILADSVPLYKFERVGSTFVKEFINQNSTTFIVNVDFSPID